MTVRMQGFTLIELMVTLVIASILLSIGVPAYASLKDRVATSGVSHRITASLASARNLAITRRTPVSLCPSRDGRRCDSTTVWEKGWIVFEDPRRASNPASTDDVIAVVEGADGMRLRSTSGRQLIRFQPDGRSPGSNVALSVCSERDGTLKSRVILNNSGRTRVDRRPGRACQ